MPANKKYLSTPRQRILKVSAAILGGYLVTTSFHLFLLLFLDKKNVLITMFFSTYILWATLMVFAFLSKNGWKIWGWYLLASLVFYAPFLYKAFVQ
ncbi:MAG: hypothetical protein KIT80_15735 [Chitinophagaceae bacterium]|nr:hypothetical protein [Chitinophagaceae bacterium]MCW5928367.1 hypothetical protein [Chitinophagaceae bacterium]